MSFTRGSQTALLLTILFRRGRDRFDRSEQKIDDSLGVLLAVRALQSSWSMLQDIVTLNAAGRSLADLRSLSGYPFLETDLVALRIADQNETNVDAGEPAREPVMIELIGLLR